MCSWPRRFQELGAQRVLIDGAAGRKSLAGAGVEGVALLCTGASLDRDMELVVAETAHTCWLFARKRPESAALCAALDGQEAARLLNGARLDPEGFAGICRLLAGDRAEELMDWLL